MKTVIKLRGRKQLLTSVNGTEELSSNTGGHAAHNYKHAEMWPSSAVGREDRVAQIRKQVYRHYNTDT